VFILKLEAAWVLRDVGILPHHYTASKPRRPRLETVVTYDVEDLLECQEETEITPGLVFVDLTLKEFLIHSTNLVRDIFCTPLLLLLLPDYTASVIHS
jgi:hypothetical protein